MSIGVVRWRLIDLAHLDLRGVHRIGAKRDAQSQETARHGLSQSLFTAAPLRVKRGAGCIEDFNRLPRRAVDGNRA